MKMKIKGAIFDLDGTLLDSMWVWDKVDTDFLGSRGFEVPLDYQKAIAAMGFRETARYTIERFRLEEQEEDIIREWNDMAARTYHEEVAIKPYVRELLEQLKRDGIRLGVATASYASLFEMCLKRNGIYDYFQAFTETKEVARGKGFPDIYIRAAEKIGCVPEECVVFEDIHQGILAAKEGGFYTVGVYEDKSAYSWADIVRDADVAIRGFEELLLDGTRNFM
jgi:HAD superfamily hydrolase (TIGR01509 family)